MPDPTVLLPPMAGLQQSDIQIILENLEPDVQAFKRCQVIMRPSGREDSLGVLLSGTAFLAGENEAADRRIVEYFEQGDLLGKHMLLNVRESVCYVISKHPCKVAFISYRKLLAYCAANQPDTIRITNILFHGLERKALIHVYILQQRTLRGKILLYFHCLRKKYGTSCFTLPMPFVDLADYLSVDRSSLMREIRKLKDEGIIKSDRRRIFCTDEGERLAEHQISVKY